MMTVWVRQMQCSPLAWGWSAAEHSGMLPATVFPTRVGMVRQHCSSGFRWPGVPHSRGDGPSVSISPMPRSRCSPLAWGWSAIGAGVPRCVEVFPTRVGMVRDHRPARAMAGRVPHSRGDGPSSSARFAHSRSCSPLAWGWSAGVAPPDSSETVFPTRVGMVRRTAATRNAGRRVPPSRGDGPDDMRRRDQRTRCSPLAWGWSVHRARPAFHHRVFPTRVGMVRANGGSCELTPSVPHSRGDGPELIDPEF